MNNPLRVLAPLHQRIRRGELAAFDDPELPLALLVEPTAHWFYEGLWMVIRRALWDLAERWAPRRQPLRESLLRALDAWAAPWRQKLAKAGDGDPWPGRRNVLQHAFTVVHCAEAIAELPAILATRSATVEADLMQMRLSLLATLLHIEPDPAAEARLALTIASRYVCLS